MIFVSDTYLDQKYFQKGRMHNDPDLTRLFVDQEDLAYVHLGLREWIRQIEVAMEILKIEVMF